jgi:branched-chain amino acid transport system permease protein
MVVQVMINSLAIGLMYVLMSSGLTLVFGILRIVNFAHGQIYMLGAFVLVVVMKEFGVNFFFGLLLSIIAMASLGVAIERVLFRPLKNAPVISLLALSLGLLFIIEGFAEAVFGADDLTIKTLLKGVIEIGDFKIAKDKIIIILISVILMMGLYYWINKTKSGIAMRAVASDREAAILYGINANQIASMVMAVGCALAAAAGGLVSSMFYVNPYIGHYPLFKGLIVISLGGMGSMVGAVIGGLLLGLIESIGQTYLNPSITDIFVFTMVIITLLIRPQGLFGVPYEFNH